jgi:protein involved in polysaccharide export with SLBB domain
LAAVASTVAFAQTTVLPKDVVDLKCAEDPSLNGEYVITDTGLILMQYIGAVDVKGLTEEAAAAKIAAELVAQQILRTATITLKVKKEARPNITVSGAVGRGGQVAWRSGLRLSDALEWAAPTSVADLARIRITSSNGQVRNVNRAPGNENPVLEPGDSVFVPLKPSDADVTVLGAVMRPGIVAFEPGMSVSDAIQGAGGYRNDADRNRVTYRPAGGDQRVLDMNVVENNLLLSKGDTIVVAQRNAEEQIYVRGAISKPGLINYRTGVTVSQVVTDAGPVEGSRLDRVKILRKDETGKTKTITVNLAKVLRKEAPDEPLIAGDIVDVPYPGKSFSFRDGLQIAGLLLTLFWLLK